MIVQYWLKEYDKIIKTADKAIDTIGKFPQAYHLRGNAYMKKQQYENAFSDLTTAIDLYTKENSSSNEHTLCLRDLGDAYYEIGKIDDAIQCYRKMFKRSPYILDNTLYFAERLLDERNSKKEIQEAWKVAKAIEPNVIRSRASNKNSFIERCEVVKIKATLLMTREEYKEKKDQASIDNIAKVKKAIDEAITKYPKNEELQKLKIKAEQPIQ
jgi:tetratricopeptide (TPR) repeat protein